MKLLLAAPLPPPYGGIANWTLLINKRIQEDENVQLTEIIDVSPDKRSLDGRTLWDRVVVSGLAMFRLRHALACSIKKERPDVIHITTSGSLSVIRDLLFICTTKKYKIPVSYHIHFGRVPVCAKADKWEWKLLKKAMELSSAVVAIDESTYQTLLSYFHGDKIYNIPNPFDLSQIPSGNEAVKKEIMFLGWCIKTKGIEELLAAWQSLSRKYPEWELVLVGPYHEDYLKELQENYSMERVVFAGEKSHDEALEYLSQSAVFTLPSYTEGFPNVVLEAMACSKPIVAAAVGAIPQMLADNSGLVIPAKDSEALEQALELLMSKEELQRQYGNKGRKRLEELYEMNVVFEQYKKVWEKLI